VPDQAGGEERVKPYTRFVKRMNIPKVIFPVKIIERMQILQSWGRFTFYPGSLQKIDDTYYRAFDLNATQYLHAGIH
jgi:hypothetical protein